MPLNPVDHSAAPSASRGTGSGLFWARLLAVCWICWTAFCCALCGLVAFGFRPVSAQAQFPVVLTTYADLVGNGAAQQVQSSGTCRWVQFVPLATNVATVRIGDSNVSSTRGVPAAPGSGELPPMFADVNRVYYLSSLYFYANSGDKVSVTCGN